METKFCKIRVSDDNLQLLNINNIVYIEYVKGKVFVKLNDETSYEFELSKDEFNIWTDEIISIGEDDKQSEINGLYEQIRKLKKGENTYRTESIQLLEGMVEDYYKQLEEKKIEIKEKDLKITELENIINLAYHKENYIIEKGLVKRAAEEDNSVKNKV